MDGDSYAMTPLSSSASQELDAHTPLVQFASNRFYANEGETFEVMLMRLGKDSGESRVDWTTLPSPHEGRKFAAAKGTLVFAPGEHFKTVVVQLLSDDHFDSTLAFRLSLSNPEGCMLGIYLKTTTVKILDDDAFPSNIYKERLKEDPTTHSWQRGESFTMLKKTVKFLYRLTPGSKKILAADQIDNIIFGFEILVMRNLVNALSKNQGHFVERVFPSITSNTTLYVYGLCLLVPFLITHWFMYRKTTWKVTGGARKVLQENLLRKYLNQDESTHFIPASEFQSTFGHDVTDLVVDGYNKVFVVAKSGGRLVVSLGLSIYIAVDAQVWVVWLGLLPFVVLPLILYGFVLIRSSMTLKMQNDLQETTDKLMHKVDKTCEFFRLVTDYYASNLVVNDSNKDIMKVNKELADLAGVMANNTSIVQWVNNILQLGWIIYGGTDVVEGAAASQGGSTSGDHIPLGTFLAVFSLFKSNGAMFDSIFDVYLTIATTYPALWRIAEFMNLPTDIQRREEISTFRLKHTQEKVGKAKASHPTAMFPMDTVPIFCDNVSFSYDARHDEPADVPNKQGVTAKRPPVWQVKDFSYTFPQGMSFAVTGPAGSGKATLLRMLGLVLPPVCGTVFFPCHLRVLHITQESVIWPGTIAENVFFGLCASYGIATDEYAKRIPWADLERGFRICKKLHFSKEMQAQVEDLDSTVDVESLCLSTSQLKLIHLARALIMNPEVLIIHHPTLTLPKDMSKNVATSLKAFVTERGIEMDPQTKNLRRPRTLFYSTQEKFTEQFADKVITLPWTQNSLPTK